MLSSLASPARSAKMSGLGVSGQGFDFPVVFCTFLSTNDIFVQKSTAISQWKPVFNIPYCRTMPQLFGMIICQPALTQFVRWSEIYNWNILESLVGESICFHKTPLFHHYSRWLELEPRETLKPLHLSPEVPWNKNFSGRCSLVLAAEFFETSRRCRRNM